MRNKILGFAVLAVASVMVAAGTGAEAREPAARIEKTGGEAVGAAVVHPAGWNVEREPYTFDKTYGYTLWRPDTGGAHDHGGRPALRVALAYDLQPGAIAGKVREVTADYPDFLLKRQTVEVAREHEGVAVGIIPGSTPSTEVYVPVNGRVYRINVYADRFGQAEKELLEDVRFEPPSRPVSSLNLPPANSPEALYSVEDVETAERQRAAAYGASDAKSFSKASRGSGAETRIAEGCWRAPSGFYEQTQHGPRANRDPSDSIPLGFTLIGVPNFWGQYTHGNFGYGRCTKPYNTNDKFAVDFPMDRGDHVWSPFYKGTVTFAGRNTTHKDYGVFVTVKAANGKYVNLSAHLDRLAAGIERGEVVDRNDVIGLAGDSGGGSIPVGPVHLHQAFYRYPKYNPDGAPYGGAGLQVARYRYAGSAAKRVGIKVRSRAYDIAQVRPRYGAFCREDIRCGEGYRISN